MSTAVSAAPTAMADDQDSTVGALARLRHRATGFGALKTLLFRSGELWVTIDGVVHRLPVSHAGAPLMVSAPGVESLVLNGRELSTTELTRNVSGRVVFSVVETR